MSKINADQRLQPVEQIEIQVARCRRDDAQFGERTQAGTGIAIPDNFPVDMLELDLHGRAAIGTQRQPLDPVLEQRDRRLLVAPPSGMSQMRGD